MKIVILAFILLLAAIIPVIHIALVPPVECPEEYKQYVSEEDIERVRNYNCGIYSLSIPMFPIRVQITYADDHEIITNTQYFFFGNSEVKFLDTDIPWRSKTILGREKG